MTGRSDATPIEDYLDELLRRTHADPRAIRPHRVLGRGRSVTSRQCVQNGGGYLDQAKLRPLGIRGAATGRW
ncbi:MAG: hypothetical protein ACRDRN_00125 [Sciscionella sp.]